ncbi:hypothetical protein HLB23_35755 [Nocardia uniformis]|uniref:Uncharacterized protein n=1 Tax=Nocardia uniformis TaxID=53432 RepID=A0A849CF93_9NOCA|nr:hypothetical protein [Nocardia uniformis]NNH75147.1 hypothetical protein [Nocardia uniformis]
MTDKDSPTGDVSADVMPSEQQETTGAADATPAVTPQARAGGYQVGLSLELEP